jgi:hypothetical protein
MANGGEQFITIGNFNDDAGTTVSQPYSIGSFGAYYFVDGVSVTPFAASGLGDTYQVSAPTAWIYSGSMYIKPGSENIIRAEILDLSGRIVQTTNKYLNQPISISGIAAGVYIIRITGASGTQYTIKQTISNP